MVANKPDTHALECLEDFKREMERVQASTKAKCDRMILDARERVRQDVTAKYRNLRYFVAINVIAFMVNIVLWLWS